MKHRHEKTNSSLSQYDRAFSDAKNFFIYGKTSHNLWKDIAMRLSRGEIDTQYNGLPLYFKVGNKENEFYDNKYDKREVRVSIDAHEYTLPYLHYKWTPQVNFDLYGLRTWLQEYNVPFIIITFCNTYNSSCVFRSIGCDLLRKKYEGHEQNEITKTVEIAKRIRSVTSTPIIIPACFRTSFKTIETWAERTLLYHNGRLTSRYNLYLNK